MKRKMTHAERITCYRLAAMHQVMGWLGWTELEYTSMIYRKGLEYLKRTMPYEEDQRKMMASNQYWGWWKLQWYVRDQAWLEACEQSRVRCQHVRLGEAGQITVVEVCSLVNAVSESPLKTQIGRRGIYAKLHDITTIMEKLEDSYCRDLVPMLTTGKS